MPCSAPPPFGSEINESEPADAFAIDPTPWRPRTDPIRGSAVGRSPAGHQRRDASMHAGSAAIAYPWERLYRIVMNDTQHAAETIEHATEPTAARAALPAKIGVLLVNLGTPDASDTESVRRYLKEFLSDPRVIEDQGLLWRLVL